MAATRPRAIWRKPFVLELTGLSKTTLQELINAGEFPEPILLTEGGRAVGFYSDEIQGWIDSRPRVNSRRAIQQLSAEV